MYRQYLKYLIIHKWYVFWACISFRVPIWIALLHDWDKFLTNRFIGMAKYYYGDKSNPDILEGMYRAWHLHQKIAKHHWEYWILLDTNKDRHIKFMTIPHVYLYEMAADYIGAHKAKRFYPKMRDWYDEHKDDILMNPISRQVFEEILNTYHD